MSHDEGETANEISSCTPIVFRALSESSLSSVEQMIWVVDAELNDEYELCQGAEEFWEQEHSVAEGITATQKQWPGIASRLRTMLREIREKENDWLSVAAFRAEDFFTQPSLKTFEELHKASEKAGVWRK